MLLLSLAASTPPVLHYPCGDSVHVAAYELDVRFDPAAGTMRGEALVFVDPEEIRSQSLRFFLHGELRVERVSAGARVLETASEPVFYPWDYSMVASETRVPLAGIDLADGLRIVYSGAFHPSGARSPSDYMRIDPDGVFLRAYGYSLWFPVFLESGSDSHAVEFAHVRIDTPQEFEAVFTGSRIDSRVEGGRRIGEWTASCDLTEAQLTARPYRVHRSGGVFVYGLEDEASSGAVEGISTFVAEITGAFARAYGEPRGAAEVHVMEMPVFGDTASGNTIGLASERWRRFPSDPGAKVTLAHELVHDYVAVPIELTDPLYALVVEGFPSYFHLPLLDEDLGAGFHDGFLRRTQAEYLARRSSGAEGAEIPLAAIGADQLGLYKDRFVLNDRALLFLEYLRRSMGSERFGEFVRRLLGFERLDRAGFERLVLEFSPDAGADLRLWLDTIEFPERFRIPE